MFTKFTLAGAVLAMSGAALVPVAPAAAQRHDRSYQDQRYQDQRHYRDEDRGYRGYRDDRRGYRGRRCNSDGGTLIGAIAGGLLGNSIAGHGDRAIGTVLGAGGGALAGRAIARSGC